MSDDSMLDSNIHLDVLTHDSIWYRWSAEALQDAIRRGRVVINRIRGARVKIYYR